MIAARLSIRVAARTAQLAICALSAIGCGAETAAVAQPPLTPRQAAVAIEPTNEKLNEWLHGHCEQVGLSTLSGAGEDDVAHQARVEADRKNGNFVEVVYTFSRSGVTGPALDWNAVYFHCKAPPPGSNR
jgi:hypothetical protein